MTTNLSDLHGAFSPELLTEFHQLAVDEIHMSETYSKLESLAEKAQGVTSIVEKVDVGASVLSALSACMHEEAEETRFALNQTGLSSDTDGYSVSERMERIQRLTQMGIRFQREMLDVVRPPNQLPIVLSNHP